MSAELENELKTFFIDLQERGVIADCANLENNFYQLNPNEKVVYLGIDCTSESLHIGHLFQLIQTIRFAKKGFTVLLVLGEATSIIGDPSDKSKERPRLATEKINQYYQEIKNQLTRIVVRPPILETIEKVEFAPLRLYNHSPELLSNIYKILGINSKDSNEKKWEKYLGYIWPLYDNKFKILNNRQWLEKLGFIDFIDKVGRNITINYLLAKETIKQRVNSKTGLSFLAFSYSLLQAYDFWYLYQNYNCHGQLGGSDQWGNLTTGLKLINNIHPTNKTFVFTFPLLTDKEGKKISKSENGQKKLWLNSKKEHLVDFFFNLSDSEAQTFIRKFTFLEEIQIRELLNFPPRLRVLQKILIEIFFWLNYGELKSLENILEEREKKVSSKWKKKER